MDKVVRKNIVSLLLYQGSALIIPLVTLPYIARVLGIIEFGRLGICLAIIQYFSLLVDYGFNLSITAKIAKVQNDINQLTKIFFITFFTKALLVLLGLAILFCIMPFKIIHHNIGLIMCCYLGVLGSFLFPIWFLQGIEKMEVISNSNLIARFLSIPLIFMLVHSSHDVYMVALIQGFTGILASILALVKIQQLKLLNGFYKPNFQDVREYLVDGWHYFVSISSVSLYTNTNILILGLVADSTAVGYFAGIDKIKNAMLSVLNPFTSAIYPKINKLMKEDEDKAFIFIAKYLVVFGIGTLVYSILIFLLAPLIVTILLGNTYLSAVKDLQVLAFLPVLIIISNFFGTQIMLSKGEKKAFMCIITICGLVNIILLSILGRKYADLGACFSLLITELIVTLTMIIYVGKVNPKFFKIFKSTIIKQERN